MTQNWIIISNYNSIFSKLYLLVCVYTYMTYKFEFFFSYMIIFFMVYYIGLLVFYTKFTNLAQKIKNLD